MRLFEGAGCLKFGTSKSMGDRYGHQLAVRSLQESVSGELVVIHSLHSLARYDMQCHYQPYGNSDHTG